jgi:MHS family proline/betaine transporter-like MFS transporter
MQATESQIGLTMPGIRRAVIASVIGNGLEWFDFLSYAYFATTISRVFFPLGDRTASLLLTLGVFAAGFIVRPFGGVLLGLYADRVGRKRALTLLIMMMAARPMVA